MRWSRLLMSLGVAGTVFGLLAYHGAVVATETYGLFDPGRFPWACVLVALLLLTTYAVGLPDGPTTRRGAWAAALAAPVGGALGVSLLQLVVGAPLLPRFVVLGSGLVLVPWFVLCARLTTDLTARSRTATRVLVVGDLADVGALWVELEGPTEGQATIVGVLSPDEAQVTRSTAPLIEQAVQTGANVVVVDGAAQRDPGIIRQVAKLHERGVKVRTLLAFYEEWLGKLPISELERVSLMFDIAEVHGTTYSRSKRLLDLGFGVLCGVACVVAIPFILVGNVVANRGPLFFLQERVGKGGRIFRIAKFRTMRSIDGDAPAEWTARRDPRITQFGRILRLTHLDELPQAWNILLGDLSIVGPRPEQPHYVDELTDKLPFYGLRHLVRPGLTGWAQVKYGYAADHLDALEKLQYEFYYLRHQRLAFDVRILVRTIRSVFGGDGR